MIIKNGTIYDGIHPAPYAGDLALREGVIAAIGPGLEPVEGERVLDAAGRRESRTDPHPEFPPEL